MTGQEVLKRSVPGGSRQSSVHGWKEGTGSLLQRRLMLPKDFSWKLFLCSTLGYNKLESLRILGVEWTFPGIDGNCICRLLQNLVQERVCWWLSGDSPSPPAVIPIFNCHHHVSSAVLPVSCIPKQFQTACLGTQYDTFSNCTIRVIGRIWLWLCWC